MSQDAPSLAVNRNGHGPMPDLGTPALAADAPTLRNRPSKPPTMPRPSESQSLGTTETNLSSLQRSGPVTAVLSSPPTPVAVAKLLVVRGLKMNVEYSIYEGKNLIGRGDDKPVDIDVRDQEPRDHVWASRNHAVIKMQDGQLTIEDLNSMNGTYVNRHRVYPGQKRTLKANDVLQIGTIQLKVTA